MSFISQRLTKESALPTAKYLHREKRVSSNIAETFSNITQRSTPHSWMGRMTSLFYYSHREKESDVDLRRLTYPLGQSQYNNNLLYEP